jgi:hypothetical protein
MDQQFAHSQKDFILLTEAGFVAINQADEEAAVKLFNAAQLLDPKNTLPRIGMGYLHFLKLELSAAGKIFQGVLTDEPENEMANALYGLSLALNPKELVKGEKILEEASKKAKDPSVKTMALTALDFVEQFVKKPGASALDGSKDKSKKK